MKITDFEIGKRYKAPCWPEETYVMFDRPTGEAYFLMLFCENKKPEYLHLTPARLNNDWVEIEEEKECKQNFIFSAKELSQKIKDKDEDICNLSEALRISSLEIDRLKDEAKVLHAYAIERNRLKNQLYDSRSKENELSNLACKFQKEAIEIIKSLHNLVMRTYGWHIFWPSAEQKYQDIREALAKASEFFIKHENI